MHVTNGKNGNGRLEHSRAREYPAKTAGRRMAGEVPVVRQSATVGEVEKLLVERAGEFVSVNYVYVTDERGILKGAVSVKEIFQKDAAVVIGDIMVRDLVTVRPHAHQEKAGMLALKHSLKAVPVVDKDGKLLGVVPSDAIMSILYTETVFDVLQSAGITPPDEGPVTTLINASAGEHVRKRLPWLIVGLFGGVLAAAVVGAFEASLSARIVLASFIPVVVYIADAVGSQTQTIFIRSLVLDGHLDVRSYVRREARIALVLAAALAAIIGSVASVFWGSAYLMLVLTATIFSTIMVSAGVGILLPYAFTKRGLDPAVASGPFATVLRDITNLFVYFGIATLLLPLAA